MRREQVGEREQGESMRAGRFTFIAAAAAALSAADHAAAQTQSPTDARASGASEIGEVVVTARRRTEFVQDVPVAVLAFSGDQLRRSGVERVSDLTRVAPGLVAQASPFGNGALTLSLRGQRQGLPNIAYDPAIPVYVDEVIQARAQGLNAAMFDLDSVQVLKGPQGTLFGRNSSGGALLITTKAPSQKFEGYVQGELGNYDLRRAEGVVNLPLGEMFALRVGGVITKRKGYTKDNTSGFALDDEDTKAWRGSLMFRPSEAISNRFTVYGFRESDAGVAYKLVYVRPGSAAQPDAAELAFYRTQPFHFTNANTPRDGTRIKTQGFSNISTLQVGDVTFKNILGQRRVKTRLLFDLDGASRLASQSIEDVSDGQWSDEFQVLGDVLDGALNYVTGVYWFREKGREHQRVELLGAGLNNTITDNEVANRSLAGYAQVTYKPPSLEALSLTGGIRYTRDKRALTSRNRFYSGVCRIVNADVNGVPLLPCIQSAKVTYKEPTYTLSADYKITPDVLAYVTRRSGYQAGGFTNSANRPAEFTPYLPQKVKDWELGLKADWHAGAMPVRTNLAVYRGKYDNIQRLTSFPAANPSGLPFTQNRILNAATSVIQGLELDVQARPVESLMLAVSYAKTDAKYKSYLIAGVDYSDAPFAGVPEDSVSWQIRWDTPFGGDFAKIAAQLDGAWQSWTVTSDATSYDPTTRKVVPFARLNQYHTINGRLDFDEIAGRQVRFSLWVRNLTDEEYYTAGSDSSIAAGGRSLRLLGAPRTWGGELTYEF